MGRIDFNIHPLFFLFGLYYSLTGKFLVFLIYTLTALVHELGHSFVASRLGYFLKKIVLLPFGAIISGDSDFCSQKDEVFIAFAGPLLNLFIGLIFVALWWIFPFIYPYTQIIVEANFSMALINFLPFFPLDGGRILFALLSIKLERKKAFLICKIICGVGVVLLTALFVISTFFKINLSLLFFSLFLLFSLFEKKDDNRYIKLYLSMSQKKLKRGMMYRKIGIDKSVTIKKLISMLNENYLNEVVVFSDEKMVAVLSPEKVEKLILMGELDKSIDFYLKSV